MVAAAQARLFEEQRRDRTIEPLGSGYLGCLRLDVTPPSGAGREPLAIEGFAIDFSRHTEPPDTLTRELDVAFEHSILHDSSFMELDLRGLRAVECRAEGMNLVGASLQEADFSGTDLSACQFSGSDLRGADFGRASNVSFDPRECRLEDTRISLEAALGMLGRLGVVVPELC